MERRQTYQKTGSVVQETTEADGKAALEKMTMLYREGVMKRKIRTLGW